jgi:hypothetical protein
MITFAQSRQITIARLAAGFECGIQTVIIASVSSARRQISQLELNRSAIS